MAPGQEKEEVFYSFPLDLSVEEEKQLKDIALEHIVKDDDALINYAVNYILQKKVNDLKTINKSLRKKIKERKNASKSKS